MICESCHKNEATVFLRQSVNGNCTEKHLCADCAKKEHVMDRVPFSGFEDFGGRNFSETFGNMERLMDRMWKEPFSAFSQLPFGGLRDAERPAEYGALREGLSPFYQNEETKKTEEKSEPLTKEQKDAQELAELKSKLADLVAAERFEEAAKVRDEIKSREK